MGTVTAVGPDAEGPGRVAIEVDGARFALVLERVAARLALVPGQEVDRAELARRIERAEGETAMELALRFLSHRARTRAEVRRRLERAAFPDDVIERVLQRLVETGLVDDEGFAAVFVRDRLALRPTGVRLLVDELYGRGIARERALPIVRRVMAEEGVTEEDLLTRAAEKKARALGRLAPATARRRLFDHLARRGFPLDDVRACVDRALAG
jgi:regulatory protein